MDQINLMLLSYHGQNLSELDMAKNIKLSCVFVFKIVCIDEAS